MKTLVFKICSRRRLPKLLLTEILAQFQKSGLFSSKTCSFNRRVDYNFLVGVSFNIFLTSFVQWRKIFVFCFVFISKNTLKKWSEKATACCPCIPPGNNYLTGGTGTVQNCCQNKISCLTLELCRHHTPSLPNKNIESGSGAAIIIKHVSEILDTLHHKLGATQCSFIEEKSRDYAGFDHRSVRNLDENNS
jgi:hypothetical protein